MEVPPDFWNRFSINQFLHIDASDQRKIYGYKKCNREGCYCFGPNNFPQERAEKIDYKIEKNRRTMQDLDVGQKDVIYDELDRDTNTMERNMMRDVTKRVVKKHFPDREYKYFSDCGGNAIDIGDPYAYSCDYYAMRIK